MDNVGTKKKSREFVKRRLALAASTINLNVEIAAHPHGSVRQLATRIQEGPIMTYTVCKRVFERRPMKDRSVKEG